VKTLLLTVLFGPIGFLIGISDSAAERRNEELIERIRQSHLTPAQRAAEDARAAEAVREEDAREESKNRRDAKIELIIILVLILGIGIMAMWGIGTGAWTTVR
jgi:hypothetical protein